MTALWPAHRPRIGIAHTHFDIRAAILQQAPDATCRQVSSYAELVAFAKDIDVLAISMLWHDELPDLAPHLRLIQSISAGTDHFPASKLAARDIRLCSAMGANAHAVSDHALALILAISRRLPEALANQQAKYWRLPGGPIEQRATELKGKTLFLVGYGHIGSRIAKLATAFDMNVVVMRQRPTPDILGGASFITPDRFHDGLRIADFVVLACPLTPQTSNLINTAALEHMQPHAALINLSRGKVVDEAALISALQTNQIGCAALDTFVEEPLPSDSPLWHMPNVLITPHAAGDTETYEHNVAAILLSNIAALENGTPLTNQIA